ncbi:MAG: hypothetical protein JXM79_09610 [Sedimentisphaerales bacterium]|nr:hypothetical protein [Sedimentisphaerales bacterium]
MNGSTGRKGHVPAGVVCNELVSNIDIAPTILGACGVRPPGNHTLVGSDWRALWQEGSDAWRDSLLIEITYTRRSYEGLELRRDPVSASTLNSSRIPLANSGPRRFRDVFFHRNPAEFPFFLP